MTESFLTTLAEGAAPKTCLTVGVGAGAAHAWGLWRLLSNLERFSPATLLLPVVPTFLSGVLIHSDLANYVLKKVAGSGVPSRIRDHYFPAHPVDTGKAPLLPELMGIVRAYQCLTQPDPSHPVYMVIAGQSMYVAVVPLPNGECVARGVFKPEPALMDGELSQLAHDLDMRVTSFEGQLVFELNITHSDHEIILPPAVERMVVDHHVKNRVEN